MTVMETKELKGREFVEALLLGSAEIDRMRKEIDQVVGMILGLLDPHRRTEDHFFEFRNWSDPNSRYSWFVQCIGKRWSVEFDYRHSHTETNLYRLFFGAAIIDLDKVQIVHAHLQFFVDGMRERFGELKSTLQPLLDAAAAAKQRTA